MSQNISARTLAEIELGKARLRAIAERDAANVKATAERAAKEAAVDDDEVVEMKPKRAARKAPQIEKVEVKAPSDFASGAPLKPTAPAEKPSDGDDLAELLDV